MTDTKIERQFHVGADLPSFSKLQLTLPWSVFEILQQLNPLDEMQMKAVNNHDSTINIAASRNAEDDIQLNIDGMGSSVLEAWQDWWNFNIKSVLSPVYLMPKPDTQMPQDPIVDNSDSQVNFSDPQSTSDAAEIYQENVVESVEEQDQLIGEEKAENLELPPNAKLVMSAGGSASILSYDMGVVLEIPEAEATNLVSVDKNWKHQLNLDESVEHDDAHDDQVKDGMITEAVQDGQIGQSLLAYQCYLCSKQFFKVPSLQSHMSKIHNLSTIEVEKITQVEVKPPHTCALCDSAWKTRSFLQKHMKKAHNAEFAEETIPSSRKTDSTRRTRKKAIGSGIVCTICERQFVLAESLRKHVQMYHSNHENYKQAMQSMLDAKFAQAKGKGSRAVLPCPVCQSMYAGVKLIKHVKTVHYDVPNFDTIVSETAKAIKSKQYRIKHEKRKQSIQCPKCKKFLQRASMYKHLCQIIEKGKDGSGKTPYKRPCPVCNKEYSITTYYSHLRRVHRVVKRGEANWHTCSVCNKSFTALYKLQKHMLIHTEERPCRCEKCGRKYKDAQSLRVHMRHVHLNVFHIRCEKCKKGFRSYKLLESHRCAPKKTPEVAPEVTTPKKGMILEFSPDASLKFKVIETANEEPEEDNSPIAPTTPDTSIMHGSDPATPSTPANHSATPPSSVDMKSGIVVVKSKNSQGRDVWSPLVPQSLPSMLAANYCKPLEVMLCEPPDKGLDQLTATSMRIKTKGLLELSKDKKGYTIRPVKSFPSEEKQKVAKPRYRRMADKDGNSDGTVIKTVHGINVLDFQTLPPSPVSRSDAETSGSVRRSNRQKRAPRRPGDESPITTTDCGNDIIFHVQLPPEYSPNVEEGKGESGAGHGQSASASASESNSEPGANTLDVEVDPPDSFEDILPSATTRSGNRKIELKIQK